jgi:large subunit ribosomal protein L15
MATLNQLKRTGKRPYRRVGRGQSSTRGKQSGRGGKGQTARAGHKVRPEMRDIIKKLPKRRGYGKNRGRTVIPGHAARAISLTKIDALFAAGEVTKLMILEKGLAKSRQPIAIVAGETSKKFSFKGLRVTAPAKAAIEKAGGSVVVGK